MELPPGIYLDKGWYELEHDGQRYFRWSSLKSYFKIDDQILSLYENGNIVIYTGSLETGYERFITLSGSTGKFSHKIFPGWRHYVFPIKEIIGKEDKLINLEVSSPLSIQNDVRELGAMVSGIIIHADKEYRPAYAFERNEFFGDIKIEYLKEGAGTKGTIFLKNKQFKTQDKVYLDIIYTSENEEFIKFESGDFHCISPVLLGGGRIFSLAIPLACLNKDGSIKFKSKALINFENIFIRRDYYDFLGLRSSKLYDKKSRENEEKTVGASKNIDLCFQWFVTWKCNHRCPYCWQETKFDVYRRGKKHEIPPELWADKFNELSPKVLYFTGGEPSLYKGLPNLIAALNEEIKLMMTSNLGPSFNIENFIQFVKPDRFKELSFSLHPTQIDIDLFFNKLAMLLEKGYRNLLVEMVLYRANIPFAKSVLNRCKQLGIPVRFDPYVPSGRGAHPLSKKDIKLMKYWIVRLRLHHGSIVTLAQSLFMKLMKYWIVRSTEHTEKEKPPVGKMPIYCPAGSRRINIDEEGNVYTCMSAIDRSKIFGPLSLPHYAPIGNIFSDDFQLLDKPVICWESFRCSACDFQDLDCAWTRFCSEDIKLPLPE